MAGKTGTGVYARETSIRISFQYRDVRHRETLRLSPTPANLKYADRLRAEIVRKIELGTFDLAEYFPDSKHAEVARAESPTFGELAKTWMLSIQHLAPSSVETYQKRLNKHLLPALGDKKVADILPSQLAALIGGIEWGSMRTRNNALIPLRGIMVMAFMDGLIPADPCARLINLKFQRPIPDPLTLEEARTVLAHMRDKYPDPVANYFEFATFTGLRPSEQIALTWGDVDFKDGFVRVQRARVVGELKDTKTSSIRDVELNSASLNALLRQKAHTFLAGKEVFLNPVTARPWADDKAQRLRYWKPTLKALGMRDRDAYQTRHTFATLNLMAGANPMWVARQMGHSNMKMLLEVYSRWIDMADRSRERNKLEAQLTVPPMSRKKVGFNAGGA